MFLKRIVIISAGPYLRSANLRINTVICKCRHSSDRVNRKRWHVQTGPQITHSVGSRKYLCRGGQALALASINGCLFTSKSRGYNFFSILTSTGYNLVR